LKELAQLSLLANRISEIQEKNLKMFPFVFFEKVKEVKIDYDLGHGIDEKSKEIQHKSSVTYYLTLDASANEGPDFNIAQRFLALETSIKELFWKDIKVQVYFNNNLVYETKNV
jgi:hypothetical protein